MFKNIKKILSANCLIFDTDKEFYQLQRDKKFMSDDLFALVLRGAAIYRVSSLKREFSIQDFISSLRKNDLKASLYVVESLFAAGTKDSILGPQIIGILVQSCSRFSHWRRKECLEYLWEADRALKERGIDSRLVVETVLTKIFSKQAG